MTDRQNLTVRLDKEVLRKARVLAAHRGTSISKMVAETIRRLVDEDEAYESARARAQVWLDEPFHFGGARPCSRDELHER